MKNKLIAVALLGLIAWNSYLTYSVKRNNDITLGLAYLVISSSKDVQSAYSKYVTKHTGNKINKGDMLTVKGGTINSTFNEVRSNSQVVPSTNASK